MFYATIANVNRHVRLGVAMNTAFDAFPVEHRRRCQR
jgi:hypothetical protein